MPFDGHSEESRPFSYDMGILNKHGLPILLILKEKDTEILECCGCRLEVESLVGVPVRLKHRDYIYLCKGCIETVFDASKKDTSLCPA